MFKLKNDDTYVGLQVSLSIDESIQLGMIIGCFTIIARDLVADVFNGAKNDGVYIIKEYVTIFNNSNDGQYFHLPKCQM